MKLWDQLYNNAWGGGGIPMMAYMGRLHPKGVPFSGFSYMKG